MPFGRQHLKLVRLPISPPPRRGELYEYSKDRTTMEKLTKDQPGKSRLSHATGSGREWAMRSKRG